MHRFVNGGMLIFPAQPLLPGQAIPILKNLQGHPEAPVNGLTISMALSSARSSSNLLLMHLVFTVVLSMDIRSFSCAKSDDFSIAACTDIDVYHRVCDLVDAELSVPMTRHGLLTNFNGIDMIQAHTHITISVEKYLTSVFDSHGWENITPMSLMMRPGNDFVKALDTAIPLDPEVRTETHRLRFRYHGAIGVLIWHMVTTRPELSFPVVKLRQFSATPAIFHYDAVLTIFRYLVATKHHGITYT
jgi:hypothetical protein